MGGAVRAPARRRSLRIRPRGFTLLEMLVVLALAAMLLAVVMPRLVKIYEAVRAALDRQQVVTALDSLGYRAHSQGVALVLGAPAGATASGRPAGVDLPNGWRVEAESPIRYLPSGACTGGRITLRYGQISYYADLVPPLCKVHLQ